MNENRWKTIKTKLELVKGKMAKKSFGILNGLFNIILSAPGIYIIYYAHELLPLGIALIVIAFSPGIIIITVLIQMIVNAFNSK